MINYLLLSFLILAACLTPIFAKLSVSEISPLSFGFFRFGAASLLFYATLKLRNGNLIFDKKDYPRLMLLGALCIPVNQFFFLQGIQLSYASHSGVIYSLNPVFAYILAIILKQEKFYLSKLFAILLTILGIFFVFYDAVVHKSGNPAIASGDILLLCAVFSFSLYLSLGKGMIEKYGALKANSFIFLIGSLFYIPLFIYDMHNFTLAYLTYKGVIGYIFLTVIVAFLAYHVWYYALKTIPISRLTTMSNISPVLTVLFSIIFLSEKLSVYFLIGGLIALGGVFIMHKVSLELT
jgi:drug/metabolite transporter (DMT)-like permease